MRPIHLGLLILVPVAGSCRTAPTAAQISGCYHLEFGVWEPPLPSYILPATVELRDTIIDAPSSRLAILSREPSKAWWQIDPDGQLKLWLDPPWPAGVKLILRRQGDALRGQAEWFQDERGFRSPKATVILRRSPCDAAA